MIGMDMFNLLSTRKKLFVKSVQPYTQTVLKNNPTAQQKIIKKIRHPCFVADYDTNLLFMHFII